MPETRGFAADDVARQEFGTSFRGFDQHEVRAFLGRLAAELAALQERERSLGERLTAAEARAVPTEIGETELENALGHETTKVLHAARVAAAEIRSTAEEQAARVLREAGDESRRMREGAGSVLAERTAAAERAAGAIRDEAGRESAARLAAAEAEGAGAVAAATERGRQMVAEAQAVRERILRDLARRRRSGQQQLEQLRAGRDRLLQACQVVQGALDGAVRELAASEPEARAAAEAAGLRLAVEPVIDLDALEREVAAALEDGLVVQPSSGTAAAEVAGDPGTQPPDEPPHPPSPASGAPTARAKAAQQPRRSSPESPFADIVAAVTTRVEPSAPPARRPQRRRRKREVEVAPTPDGVPVDVDDEGVRTLPVPDEAAPVSAAEQESATHGKSTTGEKSATESGGPAADEDGPPGAGAATGRDDAPDPAQEAGSEAGGDGADHDKAPADDVFARIRASRGADATAAGEELSTTGPVSAAGEEGEEVAAGGGPAPTATPDVAGSDQERPGGDDGGAHGGGSALVSAFEQRDAAVEPHERALTKALKRALADEQNELLDAVRTAKGVPDVETLLPSVEAHEQRYRDAGAVALDAAGETGAGGTAVDVGPVGVALGRDVVSGLRPQLGRALEGAGDDEQAANEAISAAYREWKSARAESLAGHFALAAQAEGAFVATGSLTLQWHVDPTLGCTPDCADNALAGPTAKGDAFPTGQLHPPAHPGCRCLVLPAGR